MKTLTGVQSHVIEGLQRCLGIDMTCLAVKQQWYVSLGLMHRIYIIEQCPCALASEPLMNVYGKPC